MSGDAAKDDVIQSTKRHSSDIIVFSTAMKNDGIKNTVMKHAHEEAQTKSSKGCCGKGNAEDDNVELQKLKGELDMDDHELPIQEILQKFNLDETRVPLNWNESEEGGNEWSVDVSEIKGLSDADVLRHRDIYGSNQLTPPKKTPEIITFLLHLFGDFFSLLLWGGAILCLVGYALKRENDNLYLCIVLASVVTITGVFGYFQEKKSSDLMESFKNMMPQETVVIRCDESGNAGSKVVDAKLLVPGDIIKIKYGNKVPADIRVIECSDSFKVDNSSLTGESEPQIRTTKCTDPNPLETKNLCFFGTECPEGQAVGLVVRTGDQTVMGRIAKLTSSLKDDTLSPIKQEVNLFVFIISVVAIVLGVTFFFAGWFLQTDPITNLVFMIGIIVANVPEGLILTVLVCLSLTAQRMFNSNVLVKDLEGVETLGSTTCICSDKTGTLTQNIMTVQKVCYDHNIYQAMKTADADADPNPDNSGTFHSFLRCAIVCNTAEFDEDSKFGTKRDENGSKVRDPTKPVEFEKELLVGGQVERRVQWKTNGDATESALIKFGQKYVDVSDFRSSYKEVTKIPFNSKNKFMVVISKYPANKQEDGDCEFLLTMKGAPERVINRCSRVMINGQEEDMTPQHLAQIEALQTRCSSAGLRVLGFAEQGLCRADYPTDYKFTTDNPNFPLGADLSNWTNTSVQPNPCSAKKLVFLGLYALIDPPRPQVRPAVAKCKTAGIRVIMVTGDHPITAKAIARQVGIIWGDPKRGGEADGPATQQDYEAWNQERGLSAQNRINEDGDVWFDPRLAPAIVVPGWEIIADDCHMGNKEPTLNAETEIAEVPKEKWDDILAHTQIVFARTSPQQKLIIVENCKDRGEIVAVTGDGVNDAPALRKAHIGVAMGIMGSDVSKEAADMILLDDNFASIVQGVEEGRLIFDNLKKSIAYTLSSNIPEIAPFLIFITAKMPLPLSTVLILFVDLGTDMIPAISMAWENAESDIMRRPPRNAQRDHLVTKKLIFFAYLQIGVIQALAGFFTYIVVLGDYGFPAHILPGNGMFDNWGKQTLWCETTGGMWVNQNFDPTIYETHFQTDTAVKDWDPQHPFWWEGPDKMGTVDRCTYASKDVKGNANGYDKANLANQACYQAYEAARSGEMAALEARFTPENVWSWLNDDPVPTVEDCWDSGNRNSYYNNDGVLYTGGKWVSSYQAQMVLYNEGLRPFVPFKSRTSTFYSNEWLMADLYGSEASDTTVSGFGMPVFRKKYAQYLRKAEKLDEYKKWNVNIEFDTLVVPMPTTVNPVVFYNYQSAGKYDISNYGESVGDVWFPKEEYVAYDTDMVRNKIPRYDMFNNAVAYQMITYYFGYEKAAFTKGIHEKHCKAAPHPDYKCALLEAAYVLGFGEANFTFSPMADYDFSEGKIIPSFDSSADFRKECKNTAHKDGGLWNRFTPTSMCNENEAGLKFNVASRMSQYEALTHAQTAYFVAIVVVQWADLMICKTRMNSISHQGMLNGFMNFGLIFETLLAAILCYIPYVNQGLMTRPIRFTHWLPAVPFSLWIFGYDEIRKLIMRSTTVTKENELTGQIERDPGWMERNTYY